MMISRRSKRGEWWCLRSMRRWTDVLPPVRAIGRENPDFLFETDSGLRLGLEHTWLFPDRGGQGSARANRDSGMFLSVRAAEQIYRKSGERNCAVVVEFDPKVELRRRNRSALSQAIARIVEEHTPRTGTQIIDRYGEGADELPPEVAEVRIDFQSRLLLEWRAHPGESRIITTEFREQIQLSINEKAPRLNDYLRVCDECWLMIATGGGLSAGLSSSSADMLAHQYVSPFARTYLLDQLAGRVWRLSRT